MERRRAEIIADALEEKIFDGTFADGDRMDEARLAREFGVSRTPLREALQGLARSGLIELVPRRGAFVRQPGPITLMEMFEMMAEMEAVCGRFAARRISDMALADLRAANDNCRKAVLAQDPTGYYAENERFHKTIYRESGNAFLEAETLALSRRLKPFRRQQLRFRGRLAQSLAEHEAILTALEQGDAEAAANALRGHVAIQGEKFHGFMASLRDEAS